MVGPLRASAIDYFFAVLVMAFGAAFALLPEWAEARHSLPSGAPPAWLYQRVGSCIVAAGAIGWVAIGIKQRRLMSFLDSAWEFREYYRNWYVTHSLLGQSLLSLALSVAVAGLGLLFAVWLGAAHRMEQRLVPGVLLLVAALILCGIWWRFFVLASARAYYLSGGKLEVVEGQASYWPLWRPKGTPSYLQIGICRFSKAEMAGPGPRWLPLPGVWRARYITNGTPPGAPDETWVSGIVVSLEWRRWTNDELRGRIGHIVESYRSGAAPGHRQLQKADAVDRLCREFEALAASIGPQLSSADRMRLERTIERLELYLSFGASSRGGVRTASGSIPD